MAEETKPDEAVDELGDAAADDDLIEVEEEQGEADDAGNDTADAPESAAEQDYAPAPTPKLTEKSGGGGESPDLETILDIPVTLSMELGRTSISIRNLLQLNQGSVVELERLAGEPLDVYANGTLVAHGEVVVVNEKFGIRMTDVISPQDRVKKLS